MYDSVVLLQQKFDPRKRKGTFKEVANLQLRGTTFDANHLDSFLKSEWGMRTSTSTEQQRVINASPTTSSPKLASVASKFSTRMQPGDLATNVRPSAAFLTPEREGMKQIKFFDEEDGPSTFLKREGVSTLKQVGERTVFEKERDDMKGVTKQINEKSNYLGNIHSPTQKDFSLRPSKNKISELQALKTELDHIS